MDLQTVFQNTLAHDCLDSIEGALHINCDRIGKYMTRQIALLYLWARNCIDHIF